MFYGQQSRLNICNLNIFSLQIYIFTILSPTELNLLADKIQARHRLAERLVYEGDV